MNGALTANRPPSPKPSPALRGARGIFQSSGGWGDRLFRNTTLLFALCILAIAAAIAWQLFKNSSLSRHAFGWSFLTKQIWDPVAENYGALPFIFGTVVSSTMALFLAVPLGVGVETTVPK